MEERWVPVSDDPADRLEEAICMVAAQSDVIKAVEAENARLREALLPMLDWAKQHAAAAPEWDEDCTVRPVVRICDLRRAMKALT